MRQVYTSSGWILGLLVVMASWPMLSTARPMPSTKIYGPVGLLAGIPGNPAVILPHRAPGRKAAIRTDERNAAGVASRREVDSRFTRSINMAPPVALEPTVADTTICGNQKATLRATYNGGSSLPLGAYFQWYSSPTGNTPVQATTSSARASKLELPANGNPPPSATYYVSIIYEYDPSKPPVEGSRHAITATYRPLTVLIVKADKLCPGTVAAVTLSVTNATPATSDYYWYDQPNPQGASPYPAGPTFTPTVAAPKTYYVQAVPKAGSTDCPSALTAVAVVYHQTILPSPSQPPVPVAVVKGSPLVVNLDCPPGYRYTWDWNDPNPPVASPTVIVNSGNTTIATTASHVYQKTGAYVVQLTLLDNNTPIACTYIKTYRVEVGNDLCNALLPAAGLSTLEVRRNKRNGSFLLLPTATACPATTSAFACLTGPAETQNMAVAASAVSLTELAPAADPTYALSDADLTANPFLAGAGRLRPEATYTYATPVIDTYAYSTERGRFQVVPFNWQVSSTYHLPAWRRAGLATRYSPDGQALEEQDILHIPSAVKLGYQGHSLPYLTVKNAYYKQVLFESFEHPNGLQGEDSFTISANEGQGDTLMFHAGKQSLQLRMGEGNRGYRLTLPTFTSLIGEVQLRLWLRLSSAGKPDQALSRDNIASLQVSWTGSTQTAMTVVAQTGEWMLCETTFNLGPSDASRPVTPVITYAGSGQQVWIDDVRLQPLAAQMSCYVYDWKTLKLLTSFDDQHFGLYYQYNAEGKLVRKQVETERGLLTIQETQYNLPRP